MEEIVPIESNNLTLVKVTAALEMPPIFVCASRRRLRRSRRRSRRGFFCFGEFYS